jgi:uncharacterized protein (DUF1330 family)
VTSFLIGAFDVSDINTFANSYVGHADEVLKKYGGEVLSVAINAEPLEGQKRSVVVVIRFPSEAEARNFWSSEDYAPLKELRSSLSSNVFYVLGQEPGPPK